MIVISPLSSISDRKNILQQVESIFFDASSLKNFSSPENKSAFYKRWCKDYQEYFPDEFFIMTEGDKVMGYLSGCSHSDEALGKIEVPGYAVFADHFHDYPAHLHINFHSDSRGRGLGSQLVTTYMDYLKKKGIGGLHLVTSPDAKNISFYQRLGFNFQDAREYNSMTLLFMGTILER